jgi:hypothetical protein
MEKLKKLEVNKILRELEFFESDLAYKNEIVSKADSSFITSLNVFLEKNPIVKEVFDKKVNPKINTPFNQKPQTPPVETPPVDNVDDKTEDFEEKKVENLKSTPKEKKPAKLKKLYREIVKSTHPDKVSNKKLNELYIRATKFYESNDLPGTFSVCLDLDIDFDMDDIELELINTKIEQLRQRISFMESTMAWRWYLSNDSGEKDKIILDYIQIRLNN